MNQSVYIKQCHKESNGEYKVEFSCGDILLFSSDEVIEHGLYSEEKQLDSLYDFCVMILSKRMMAAHASYVLFSNKTRFQVQRKMQAYVSDGNISDEWIPYTDDAIKSALKRLEELEYINDSLYAQKYAANALLCKGASKNSVLNDLVYKKGIAKEIAEEEIFRVCEQNEELESENAYKLLKKKTKSNFPTEQKEIDKLYRYAMGKGFSRREIEDALDIIKSEVEEVYE